MNKKITIRIIIVTIVTITIIIGGYFWLHSQSKYDQGEILKKNQNEETTEATNWQTYRNEKYKFEIKYPQEWFTEPFREGLVLSNQHPDAAAAELPGQVLIQIQKK